MNAAQECFPGWEGMLSSGESGQPAGADRPCVTGSDNDSVIGFAREARWKSTGDAHERPFAGPATLADPSANRKESQRTRRRRAMLRTILAFDPIMDTAGHQMPSLRICHMRLATTQREETSYE